MRRQLREMTKGKSIYSCENKKSIHGAEKTIQTPIKPKFNQYSCGCSPLWQKETFNNRKTEKIVIE